MNTELLQWGILLVMIGVATLVIHLTQFAVHCIILSFKERIDPRVKARIDNAYRTKNGF